jgi:hypothetical protein
MDATLQPSDSDFFSRFHKTPQVPTNADPFSVITTIDNVAAAGGDLINEVRTIQSAL